MKSLAALASSVVLLSASATFAQTPAGSMANPRPVSTVPIRPAPQTPAETAGDLAQTERLAIQSDLAWVDLYNGVINGDVSDRMITAIKAFQKDHGAAKVTGVLNPQERTALADAARKLQENAGWRITTDPVMGARLGLPLKLVPQVTSDANGSTWASSTGSIRISLARRKEASATTASLADVEKKAYARKADYSVVKPDFFVVSGAQGLKKFYVRGQVKGSEVRLLTVLYDQATEGTMRPVVIAMSSAFNAFPGPAQPAIALKPVEYSTGIVVSSDGAILADRSAVTDCQAIVVPGFSNADRVGDDEASGLALLRIYGDGKLVPLAMAASTATSSDATINGIADPQNQNGGHDITSVAISNAQATGTSPLLPLPPGFSGAAVTDSNGQFIAMVRTRPAMVAGPGAAAGTATLITASTLRDFLQSRGIATTTSAGSAKASLLRLICIRK